MRSLLRSLRAPVEASRRSGMYLLIVLLAGGLFSNGARSSAAERRAPELRPIDAISAAGEHLVSVRGAVTLITRRFFVIQDQSGAVEVRPTAGGDAVSIGDEVQVTGVAMPGARPALKGSVQRLWSGSAPLAGVITPDFAADGQNELSLVNISGRVAGSRATPGGGLRITLQGGHQFFTTYLPDARHASERWPAAALSRALHPGTTLQITGVLDAVPPAHGAQGSFTLAVRSLDDIAEIAGPPWWTPVHITGVFLALAIVTLALVALQVRNLRLRFKAVTQERLRIARDIHDTMAQGFAGIALQLQAAEHTLPAADAETRRHLHLALSMVRYSRNESHRSIQMLRSLAAESSLATMLEQAATQAAEASATRIEVVVQGHQPELPYDTAIQLYRIGQEAIANAVQHASATRIELLLRFGKGEITLSVVDDGHGFDPNHLEAQREANHEVNQEHFGLAGIGERIEGMRGRFSIESSTAGSRLFVAVPWPA